MADAHSTHDDAPALDGTLFGAEQPCFGCGPTHPVGFRLRFARDGAAVTTRFLPGPSYQGPPGIMHGGLVTTLADEIAAWAVVVALGKFGFTVQIEAKLRKALRIGVPIDGRGEVLRDGGRIVRVGVTLSQAGEEAFSGTFSFALLDRDGAERLLGGDLPDGYERFAR